MSHKILIVEDSPDQAELIRIFFEKHAGKFDTRFSSSGADCLDQCGSQSFDAIVLDYKLPDFTGVEVLNHLRSSQVQSPVVIITAQGDEKVAVEAMKSGASDYVAKDRNYLLSLPKVLDTVIERAKLQNRLRQKEEFLAKIIEKADDFIFSLDLDLNFRFVNARIAKLGYREEEMLGQSFFKLFAPGQDEDGIRGILKNPDDKNNEIVLLSARGEPHNFMVSFSILTDGESNDRRIVGIAKDMTETLHLLHQIRDSKNKLQALFDGITDYILVVDRNYGVLMANERVAALVNAAPDKVVGEDARRLLSGLLPIDERIVATTRQSEKAESAEIVHGERVYEVWTYPMLDDYGGDEHVIIYLRDVTEQKGIERKLIQSEKLATIGLLASGVAHELRNPLNIIETARYYIADVLDGSYPKVHAKLDIINRNVGRSSNIINNLLEFSRHSNKDKEHIDVNHTLDNTLSLIEKDLDSQNIRVTKDYGDVPPAFLGLDSLKQVCLNVIINAIHAMPDGGELRIETASQENGRIRIDIGDTGHGIPEDEIGEIFAPFYTTKEVGEGTGLGMYISHAIIKREGGEISLSSQVGEGTVFTIVVPGNGKEA